MKAQNNFKQKLYALLLLIAMSAAGFVTTGEQILRFEMNRFHSYATPVYLFNVLVSFCCLAVGSVSFIELSKVLRFAV